MTHAFIRQIATSSTAAKLTQARYGTSSPPACLVSEFVYYNHQRSHMERDHFPPVRKEPEDVATLTMDLIEIKSYVGGLVKSFERKAA